MTVTVQQHHIFGRSARLTYSEYAAPVRLPESAAPLNGYRTGRESDFHLGPPCERI
jgi:hypothetical protein